MSDKPMIQCRFVATPANATALVNYRGIVMTIRVPRTDAPDEDMRNLKTLLANLPEVLARGTEEIWVQDQARRLDYEIEEFFRDLDADDGKSME